MAIVKIFVGLDYHQDKVQVCVLDEAGQVLGNRAVRNDAKLIRAIAEPHGQVQAAAIEACCGAANMAQELVDQGWSVSLAHPGYVARMKQNPDKTDFTDARLLADLLRVGYLPKVWLAPERIRVLRRLVRFRQELVDERRSVKLRMRALLRENRLKAPEELSPWTKGWLAWLRDTAPLGADDRWMMTQHLERLEELSKRITATEQRLKERTQDDAVVQKLLEEKGVGPITAVTLRAEIGHFDRFQSGKQLAKFCGVTPRNASSGDKQADAGLIRAGNPQVRRVLIELAHRLINSLDERWGKLAGKLMQAGKKRNIVVCAIANRWIRWLFHQMQPGAVIADDQTTASAAK
jgi:transposase